jgi:hypothetical protein
MTIDRLMWVARDQAFTATAVATDSIPLSKAGRDVGVGHEPLVMRALVKEAATFDGTQTYELQIVGATDADGTTGQELLVTTGTIATADVAEALADGKHIDLSLPEHAINRYAAAGITHITGKLVGANTPAVTLDIFFAPASAMQNWTPYPAAITVI